MNRIDLFLFQAVHQLAGKQHFLDLLGKFFSDYALYAFVMVFFLWAIFVRNLAERKARIQAGILASVSAIIARFFVTEILKDFIHRPRPSLVLGFQPMGKDTSLLGLLLHFLPSERSLFDSFPSGHATFFFAFATIIFLFWRNVGALFLVIAVLIGLARIYVGLHWPSDILGGAIIGIVTSGAVYFFFRKYQK